MARRHTVIFIDQKVLHQMPRMCLPFKISKRPKRVFKNDQFQKLDNESRKNIRDHIGFQQITFFPNKISQKQNWDRYFSSRSNYFKQKICFRGMK